MESSVRTGYRRRPFWTVAAAIAFMLAPLGNLLWTLYSLNIPRWWSPQVWRAWVFQVVSPGPLVLMFFIFLAGIGLLFVRRGSWAFATGSLAAVLVYNLINFRNMLMLGPWILTMMLLVTGGLVFVFGFSPFRLPYINPRLRWWETSPRFRVDLEVNLGDLPQPGVLVDISRTGALVSWERGSPAPKLSGSTQLKLPTGLAVNCAIVRETDFGYGLRFENLSQSTKKALKSWLDDLARREGKALR